MPLWIGVHGRLPVAPFEILLFSNNENPILIETRQYFKAHANYREFSQHTKRNRNRKEMEVETEETSKQ